MKLSCISILLIVAMNIVRPAAAANLVPAWEFLITQPNVPLPVMTNYLNDVTDSDLGDGHSVLDTIGPLRRFDGSRLLIGVRENGINESAPGLTTGQIWVSTNYPDRSLIWINSTNGQPMGIALNVGLYPVALDSWFIAQSIAAGNPDYTNQYYWSFDVSADGRVYTGYKNKILRYEPDGSGGISPVPHVVFTLTTNVTVHGDLYTASGSFPMIKVSGTGTNTLILAGGMSGQRGGYRLATTDGTNFFTTSWLPGGASNAGSGAFSALIPSQSPSPSPGEEWVFGSWYPGSSSGAASSFTRMLTASPYNDPTNNFAVSSGFNPGGDPSATSPKYTANFIGCVDTSSNLNYVVAYSTPSWNSFATTSGSFLPGWLAVHDAQTGAFLSSHIISVRESDALLANDNAAKWEGNQGFLSLNRLATNQIEVLWCSGVYGYGRYLVDPAIKITSISKSGASALVTFVGFPLGQLQRVTNLNTVWQNIGTPSPQGVAISDPSPPPGKSFYRIRASALP
jgi:hypothetical protein